MPHCYAFKSSCAAKELPTALNVLHAHGSLRGADIDIFTSVDVCIHFISWNVLFCKCLTVVTVFFKICFLVCGFVALELINKLNFLEDKDQEASPAMSTNPFDEPDDSLHPNHFNPFGDPDVEGMF